jgi:hypothetical protein
MGGEAPPEADREKPVISLQSTLPEVVSDSLCGFLSERVIKVSTDSVLTIDLLFEDNQALSQYKIDIHQNFDCHVHERSAPWKLLKIVNLEGTYAEVSESFTIPTDASVGDYHFLVLCLDEAGNEADFVEYDIKIENAVDKLPPTVELSLPAADTSVVNKGDAFALEGTIADNLSLNNGRWELYYYNTAGDEFTALQEYFSSTQGTEYILNTSFTLPPTATSGLYRFELKTFDEVNNEGLKVFYITLQ